MILIYIYIKWRRWIVFFTAQAFCKNVVKTIPTSQCKWPGSSSVLTNTSTSGRGPKRTPAVHVQERENEAWHSPGPCVFLLLIAFSNRDLALLFSMQPCLELRMLPVFLNDCGEKEHLGIRMYGRCPGFGGQQALLNHSRTRPRLFLQK